MGDDLLLFILKLSIMIKSFITSQCANTVNDILVKKKLIYKYVLFV